MLTSLFFETTPPPTDPLSIVMVSSHETSGEAGREEVVVGEGGVVLGTRTIDLTHALISSLPALNRGLYQAVTSARGVLTRRKKAVLGITLRLAGSQTCTIYT